MFFLVSLHEFVELSSKRGTLSKRYIKKRSNVPFHGMRVAP